MSSSFRRTLPARPNLDQQKKLAKELLQAYRAGKSEAVERVRAALPDKRDIALADAQFDLAKQYGFASWRALKSHIDTLTLDGQIIEAARTGDLDRLTRLVDDHPDRGRPLLPAVEREVLRSVAHGHHLLALLGPASEHQHVLGKALAAGR